MLRVHRLAVLWEQARETGRLRTLVDKVKDAELELAAVEAEEAATREAELEAILTEHWSSRCTTAEAAAAELRHVSVLSTTDRSLSSPNVPQPHPT